MTPLSIKVCGMTEAENIREVEQLGVDMIGFIFYPKSPRCLCELPDYLPVHAKRVGVFVNENKENILIASHWITYSFMVTNLPSTVDHYATTACISSRHSPFHIPKI